MFGTICYLHVNCSIIFQLTVDGVNGLNGTRAAQSVLEALKDEPGPVTTPYLRTVERIVIRRMLKKVRNAMPKYSVQVKLLNDVPLYQYSNKILLLLLVITFKRIEIEG